MRRASPSATRPRQRSVLDPLSPSVRDATSGGASRGSVVVLLEAVVDFAAFRFSLLSPVSLPLQPLDSPSDHSRHHETLSSNSSRAPLDPRRPQANLAAPSSVRRRRDVAAAVAAAATSSSDNSNKGTATQNKKKKWGQDDWRERIASARPGGSVVSGGDEIEQLLEERRRRDAEAEFYADGDSDGGEGDDEIVGSFALDDDEDEEDFIFIPDDPDEEDEGSGKKSKKKPAVGTEEVVDLFLNPAWGLKVLSSDDDDDGDDGGEKRGKKRGSKRPSSPPKQATDDDAAAVAAALGLRDASALSDPRSALSSIPKHVLSKLAEEQRAAVEANRDAAAALRARKSSAEERKLHRVLRLLGGRAAGVRLLSSRGENTRPMMEKVRAALFDMLLSRSPAGAGRMPSGSTWLDLFAGTGSVGLEAVSRGAAEAHFVECEPWVVSKVLRPNIESVSRAFERSKDLDEEDEGEWYDDDEEGEEEEEDFDDGEENDDFEDDDDEEEEERQTSSTFTTTIHPTRAEQFVASYRGEPFDFVSVCPPYVKVSYTELLGAMDRAAKLEGRLFHDGSVVVVEYPGRASREIPRELGPLVRVRDRRYGRTNVAVYGPRG